MDKTQLIKWLEKLAKDLKVNFTLKGSPISLESLFDGQGLMPALAKRADQLSQLCFGYGLGLKLEDNESSLIGSTVQFDEFTPDSLRLFCIYDVLLELVKVAPPGNDVPLDELLYD